MKHVIKLKTILAICMFTGAAAGTHAETIQQGILSTTTAATPGSAVAGTVDTAYVTAIFGTNAYIQDGTGGIYAYQAAKAGNPLNGLSVGSQVSVLGNASFQYFSSNTQFEFATPNASTLFTASGTTPGTAASIPTSYYTTVTTAAINSTADQGSATSQGIQNQLVVLNGVTITPDPTTAVPNPSATTFTSGGTYTLTDSSGTTLFYINATSKLVGDTVPSGATTVSGVFQDFKGTSEVLPRDIYDVVGSMSSVPEPSTYLAGALTLGAGVYGVLRRRRTV